MLLRGYLIMQLGQRALVLYTLCTLMCIAIDCQAQTRYQFVVRETPYRRLCSTKRILTVNGKFPGPTLYVRKGETIFVDVFNMGEHNITIHWHGVKQPRNPWSDGPAYITQCPIKPGAKFSQKVIFSEEEGTIWWHAHSDWARATVHGAIAVYPKFGSSYPFPRPNAEKTIILGEWWKEDVKNVLDQMIQTGGDPLFSDAFTINGQPGDLYPCSRLGTFKLRVTHGRTYLLRIVNAAINTNLFMSIAQHKLTVVGTDGSYVKPLTRDYIVTSPGQTVDVLLHANQNPGLYYMAARAYASTPRFDNTTTTAILQYYRREKRMNTTTPLFPYLPPYNDTNKAFDFFGRLRSLANKEHPVNVPTHINNHFLMTISINALPCPMNKPCNGPEGKRLAASINNIRFVNPRADILEAYYYRSMNGVFGTNFPRFPPVVYNYTGENLPEYLEIPKNGTEVILLDYGSNVDLVFQGTNLVGANDHPMHLHGHSFYIVGYGFGNFDEKRDPLRYNLIDPPHKNTVTVPRNGWAAIRFRATNPGVWFMHCHLDRHQTWGMDTVFIVKNGKHPTEKMLPPPPDMPPC